MPGAGVEHPVGVDLGGQRAAEAHGAPLAEPAGQHVDESRPAVGLRGQRQLVVRPGPPPAVGDRLGGLHRGEAVAVAVGGDQHAEAVRAGHLQQIMLAGVNLLGRKKDNPPPEDDEIEPTRGQRNGREGARRPLRRAGRRPSARCVAPARPHRARADDHRRGQAQRRKEVGGPKLSREERREEKVDRRAAMSERRERMMAGDDDYLLPRDKGPVRRLARDIVDSRRISVLGLFMPAALGLIFIMLAVPRCSTAVAGNARC